MNDSSEATPVVVLQDPTRLLDRRRAEGVRAALGRLRDSGLSRASESSPRQHVLVRTLGRTEQPPEGVAGTPRLPILWVVETTRAIPEALLDGDDHEDFVRAGVHEREFLARLARLADPSVERSAVGGGLEPSAALLERLDAAPPSNGRTLVVINVPALVVQDRLSDTSVAIVEHALATRILGRADRTDLVARHALGSYVVVLDRRRARVEEVLAALHERLVEPISTPSGAVFITPAIGLAEVDGPAAEVMLRAVEAAERARARKDLQPVRWTPEVAHQPLPEPLRRMRVATTGTAVQILLSFLAGLVLPFLLYLGLDALGYDVTDVVYLAVVAALVLTALGVWAESLLALRETVPPQVGGEPPRASIIIAAYLPNEASTILGTLDAFSRLDHPDYEVVLAYNTPTPLPLEARLVELAEANPWLKVLRVDGSTSKAQNVDAALDVITGRYVGIFDADHHPEPGVLRRAWAWLATGADVVQGRCVVRNGDESPVARTIAVEFEVIYGVAHPGRARLHGFGIFGGSNGFWSRDAIHAVRLHGQMLTEDIDASLRAVSRGLRIVSDPGLVSRELAPTTWRQLWRQRTRWAQGWFQVTLRHTLRAALSPDMTFRQRVGAVHLLLWRDAFPWLSLQIIPLLAFWLVRGDALDWRIPVFVVTTVLVTFTGPLQIAVARRVAHPDIRSRRGWFLRYLVVNSVFYAAMRNLIGRAAQYREILGRDEWNVTTRSPAPRP